MKRDGKSHFEHRKAHSRGQTGKEPVISPYVPDTLLSFSKQQQRWRGRVRGIGSSRWHARLVWEHNHGPVPDGFDIHHKNGKHSAIDDDCIDNLRLLPADWNRSLLPALVKGFSIGVLEASDAYAESEHDKDLFPRLCAILLTAWKRRVKQVHNITDTFRLQLDVEETT